MSTDVDARTPHADAEDAEEDFSFAAILEASSYVLLALRRHKLVTLFCLAVMIAAAIAGAVLFPPPYHVEARILAQRNQIIASLGNPTRSLPSEVDAPTRAAAETVLQYDNVLTLIRQTRLVERWQNNRRFVGRLVDRLRNALRGTPTEEDLEEALASMIRNSLHVWTTGDQVVVLDLYWPDAETAFHLVQAAQENFLENRHRIEIAVIAESIAMLEQHAKEMRGAVDVAIDDYRRRRSQRPALERAATQEPSSALGLAASETDIEQAKLISRITASRRAVADLEDYRDRRLAELQSKLAELRAVYADSHPSVVNMRQSIEAVSQDSPSLAAARKELEDLEAEYVRTTGTAPGPDLQIQSGAAPLLPVEPVRVTLDASDKVEPQEDYARQRMNAVVNRYNAVLGRIDAAQMELDAARAAFKYRYVIVQPARWPKKPSGKRTVMILVAGLAAGLGLGILVPVLLEIKRGRLLFPWQVERSLGLPLLASERPS